MHMPLKNKLPVVSYDSGYEHSPERWVDTRCLVAESNELSPSGGEEIVRYYAHAIYERRGQEEGHALDDWLRAEGILLAPFVWTSAAFKVIPRDTQEIGR